MDLKFLTLSIPVSLMFTNLNTSSHIGLHRELGRFVFKGNQCRKSASSTQTTHVTITVPANYNHHPQPVTTSNIPIKLLSFIGIPACSLNSVTHCPGNQPPHHHTHPPLLPSPSPFFLPIVLTGLYVFLFFIIPRGCKLFFLLWLCLK